MPASTRAIHHSTCLLITGLLLALSSSSAGAVTITRFDGGADKLGEPYAITSGPQDSLWFTDFAANHVDRITTSGTITRFPSDGTALNGPKGITRGPDGNLWFTNYHSNTIDRMTPSGTVTEFTNPALDNLSQIVTGHDGAMWFLTGNNGQGFGSAAIGRITTSGTMTFYPPPAGTQITGGLVAGPDGNVWFDAGSRSDQQHRTMGRITPAGAITMFPIPAAVGGPPATRADDLTAGTDGAVWFTIIPPDSAITPGRIGRIAPDGTVTTFADTATTPFQIVTAANGDLWFTDFVGPDPELQRMTPTGQVTLEAPAGALPTSLTSLTLGPDGNLWFTTFLAGGTVGRISGLDGPPAPSGPPPAPIGTPVAAPITAHAVSVTREILRPATIRTGLGTSVSFVISATDTVRVTVTTTRPGHRSSSGRCAAPTRANRTRHRCARTVTLPGHITRHATAGANIFPFEARLNGHALHAGSYRLVITPSGADAHAGSAALRVIAR